MSERIDSTIAFFLVGLGIGSLIGILFAPKSGEEAREYIAKKTKGGNEIARKKVRKMRARADEIVERGKEMITQTKGQIATTIDAGRETYSREKAKAQAS